MITDPTVPATQEEANSLALTVENLRAESERLREKFRQQVGVSNGYWARAMRAESEVARLREYVRLA